MKIYYLVNNNKLKGKDIQSLPFCGLVSIDIGYRTCGITIVNPSGEFRTIDLQPINKKVNLTYLGIPEYLSLSFSIGDKIKEMIERNPKLSDYMWSMEIPNIVGSYAPALSMLVSVLTNTLISKDISIIFFTGNRLGGYFLKKRSYTKTEIKRLVIDKFYINYKISDHEADSLLQAYSIYKGVFDKSIKGICLRDFTVELKDITSIETN